MGRWFDNFLMKSFSLCSGNFPVIVISLRWGSSKAPRIANSATERGPTFFPTRRDRPSGAGMRPCAFFLPRGRNEWFNSQVGFGNATRGPSLPFHPIFGLIVRDVKSTRNQNLLVIGLSQFDYYSNEKRIQSIFNKKKVVLIFILQGVPERNGRAARIASTLMSIHPYSRM